MSDLNKIVDQLSKLTVVEAAELSKQLEDKWGVTATAAAAPVAAAPIAAPDPAQEYYTSLLAQGYDAQSAAQYTSQHYPGFQG